ncbi:hypothetical protein H0I25_03835 [Cellulophaga sp. HaHa_2_95]|uniref:hypothetical protein n=1 Tax=unclassified Cellulophaga TaxID=2634405 RepID=UPI001C4ED372|nr:MULTISPECIES: hypothetical protein [unclassified Cellulophaga]QXP50744.1 hypothetical protein H0I24_11320 [Cellulophaga sp. HaHa_2_1]QXP56934.1 hypothetical protein H0I25_03835 [Cellulophaga sp. HaHa_2_95]
MKKLGLILSVIAISLTFSCKDSDTKEVPTQMQQVMAVHDEVMPKMSTIGRLISKIDEKIQETDSTETLLNAQADLRDANKSMMEWMKGFGDRFESDEIMKGKKLTKEKQRFLDEEEVKVKALRDKMNTSIENAEALLK